MTPPVDDQPDDQHGALVTLSRTGTERGADAVLAGARHDVRRHQRRRRIGVRALAALAVLGLAGAGFLVFRPDDAQPSVTTGDPATQPDETEEGAPDPQPRVVTGVRIEAHDGFDRVVFELAGDPPPEDPDAQETMHEDFEARAADPRCNLPDRPVVSADLTWEVPTDVLPTDDGLPAELSGQRISGEGRYVREVVPLCASTGHTSVAISYVDPSLSQRNIELPPDADLTEDPLEGYDFTGELTFHYCEPDDPDEEVLAFFQYSDPDGSTLPPGVCP